jgi:cellulose synthase/poly-beta-1,6-N-acetylglucosamine synthase-like glycosyltransferase
MKVHVVIPTYRRPEKLARCLASLERQTYPDVEVLAIEDEGREFAIGIWNRLAPTVTEGAFVYLCDDVELDPGCLAAAVEALSTRWPDTDGVIGFHQRNIQGKAGTAQSAMGMIGARFLDRFPGRQPFCPDYSRFHFDSELGVAARQLGRFHFCLAASLLHYHPAHYKAELDETHAVVRDPAEVQLDRVVWERRRAAGLVWGIHDTLIGRDS